jgi:hypothetical protein
MRVDEQQIPLQMPLPALLTQRQTVNLSDRSCDTQTHYPCSILCGMLCIWFVLPMHAIELASALRSTRLFLRVDDSLIPLQMPSQALLTQRQTVFKVI